MRFEALRPVVLLGAIVGLASQAFAQQAQPQLSSADMLGKADAVVQNAVALSETVHGLIREATDNGDVMKVTCLNDKVTEIDGNLTSAQQHVQELRKATDPEVRLHQYTMIMVVSEKLDVLGQEAGQCVGKDLYETGTTTVDTIIDTDMLPFEDDPGVLPTVLPPSLPTLPPAISGMR